MPGCEPLLNADASEAMKLSPDNLFQRKWKSFQTWVLVPLINHKRFMRRGKHYGNYISMHPLQFYSLLYSII